MGAQKVAGGPAPRVYGATRWWVVVACKTTFVPLLAASAERLSFVTISISTD